VGDVVVDFIVVVEKLVLPVVVVVVKIEFVMVAELVEVD